MSEARILIFGDSHCVALMEALEDRPDPAITIMRRAKVKKGRQLGPHAFGDVIEAAKALGEDDLIVSLIGGNGYALISTLQQPEPVDFLADGEETATRPDAPIIPRRVIEHFLDDHMQTVELAELPALRDVSKARIVHAFVPPPKKDNDFIRQHHEARFRDEIATLGVSDPALRLKAYALQCRHLAQFCQQIGVEVLPPPDEAVDGEGYLKSEYYRQDATHANRDYGALVLDQVRSMAGRRAP